MRKVHARDPLYSKGAVIPWWLQSTSVQNSVPSCLKGYYFAQYFTSENIHSELLLLINPAMYLLNKIFVGRVIVATAPELCQKCDFFPEKEDERNFCKIFYV